MTVSQIEENELRSLFAEVLGLPEVDGRDSFFDLGGHSLSVSKLVRLIRTRLGVKISMHLVYENPTPESLAKHMNLTESNL